MSSFLLEFLQKIDWYIAINNLWEKKSKSSNTLFCIQGVTCAKYGKNSVVTAENCRLVIVGYGALFNDMILCWGQIRPLKWLLKYGFCKKSPRKDATLTRWTLLAHFFSCWSGKKVSQNCSTVRLFTNLTFYNMIS